MNLKILFLAIIIWQLAALNCFSQAAFNLTGVAPDASAMLDVSSTNKGVLIPRIALINSTSSSPVTSPAISLLVYNTATASDVSPGYYYWNGTKWISLSGGSGGNDWGLLGNAGTATGTNFIGTTDPIDWVVKTNNIERIRVLSGGNVGIGSSFTAPNAILSIKDGHFQVQQTTAPTITATTSYVIGSQSLSNATDMAGKINILPTATAGSVTVTFSKPFTTAPIVVISPTSALGASQMASAQVYVTSTTTTFTVNFGAAPTAVSRTYNYLIIETQ